jgi:hypothetical protein
MTVSLGHSPIFVLNIEMSQKLTVPSNGRLLTENLPLEEERYDKPLP